MIKKVYHICPGDPENAGGIGRYIQYITNHSSYDTQVLDSYGNGGKMLSMLHTIKVMLHIIWLGVCKRRGTIIHIHSAAYGSFARKSVILMTARLMLLPSVFHIHGSEFAKFYHDFYAKKLISGILRLASAIIVLGSYWHKFAHETMALDQRKIFTIHNGVPDHHQQPIKSTEAKPKPIILFLGQLSKRKGLHTLIEAVAKIAVDFKLVVAGNGDIGYYTNLATKFGIKPDKIIFHQWLNQQEVIKLLRQASIFTLPSFNEGLPMAILEAMSVSLPIITTDAGSILDAVIDGENGIIIKAGDAEALAQAISSLLTDTNLAENMAKKSREIYAQHFTIDICCQKLERLYQQLI
jgi:glycosyltransferase involved in cell wall biosynthesis